MSDSAEKALTPLSTQDVERISREQAAQVLAEALRRMGIDPAHPEIWNKLFSEVKPEDVRTAVQLTMHREKVRHDFLSTIRSEFIKNAMTGIKIILVAGLLYIFTLGEKK
jgi:hypothetical protein